MCRSASLLVVLSSVVSASCDTTITTGQRNFTWTHDRTRPFDQHVEAYTRSEGESQWVVLEWIGAGQLGGDRDFVVLRLVRKVDGGVMVFEMEEGFALQARVHEEHATPVQGGRLDAAGFRGRGDPLTVRYNGPVSSYNFVERRSNERSRWMRFDVRPRRDAAKVKQILEVVRRARIALDAA